jgi:hypothetical protein
MTDSTAADPVALAIASLGEPLATHRVGGARARGKMIVGFGLIVLGILAIVLWSTVGPGNIGLVGKLLFMPLFFGVALIAQVLWNQGVTVYAYPVGVLRVGRGKVETYLWDEIVSIKVRYEAMAAKGIRNVAGGWDAVWFEGKLPTVRLWTTWVELKRADGETLKLTAIIDDFASLATRCQRETFARMWPAALDALAAGQPVGPGLWVADATGLTLGKGRHAWADVKNVEIAARAVKIGQTSFWKYAKTVDLAVLDNPHVLFALLDERVGDAVADVTPSPVPEESNAGES